MVAGVDQDHREAVRWYRMAAEAGNAVAMNNLGFAFMNGQGTNQDEREAIKWYKKAAEAGSRMAMFNLGMNYNNGTGVKRNHTKAAEWYSQALLGSDELLQNTKTAARKVLRPTLREIQRILQNAGVYSGALDGAYGPQTEAALEAYSRL